MLESKVQLDLTPWPFEDILNLRVDLLADTPSFLFLWVGSSEGLDLGRILLKKWGFRRCEDIVWIKVNKNRKRNYTSYVSDRGSLLRHTKEHCLIGIKGTVRRGQDTHFIHANIDTDILVDPEPEFGSTEKPIELYQIIERFCLGRKRIELFGMDHNIRKGWLTLGKAITSSNFDKEEYEKMFRDVGPLTSNADEMQCEGGRYLGSTSQIESLRPRSPNRNPGTSLPGASSSSSGPLNPLNALNPINPLTQMNPGNTGSQGLGSPQMRHLNTSTGDSSQSMRNLNTSYGNFGQSVGGGSATVSPLPNPTILTRVQSTPSFNSQPKNEKTNDPNIGGSLSTSESNVLPLVHSQSTKSLQSLNLETPEIPNTSENIRTMEQESGLEKNE